MKISYYPGCTLKTKAKNLEKAAVASLEALGIEVEEIERWNCCGAVHSLTADDLIHQVGPVRNLIRAKEQGADKINVWGTGIASRDYLFADDAAEAIVLAAELRTSAEPLNLGNNREVTIRETAETIARIVGFEGELVWDSSRPDGQPRRRVDASRAERELGWHAHTEFEDGLRRTVDWYLANRELAEKDPN